MKTPLAVSGIILGVFCFAGLAFGKEATPQPRSRVVTLFFEWQGQLRGERSVIPLDGSTEKEIQYAINLLTSGFTSLGQTVPKNAKVQTVFKDINNTVYLNFNENIVADHPGGVTLEILTVSSICKTIFTNFDVDGVMILSKGKELKTLAGSVDMEYVLGRAQCDRLEGYRK